jgi:rsbT co-antagonist protein RsbR
MSRQRSPISDLLEKFFAEILEDWLKEQQAALTRRRDLINDGDLRVQSSALLTAMRSALTAGATELDAPHWEPVRARLTEISRARATQGFSPSETAMFVFSLKQPLLHRLRNEAGASFEQFWEVTSILDRMGLYTTEIFQQTREEVISRQQTEMLELSTPVVELWEGILALPVIGTLDSRRTQMVMETLLERIVETGSEIAIIDITGVPTVDTLTAQHLIKTITATRLMGAECIISGIRPQIAQTIVHLGVDLGDVLTKSSLAAALALAIKRLGLQVVKQNRAS